MEDVLAIHPISHTTVTGDAVPEILQVERALEPRGEESSEGRYERGKGRENEAVELIGGVRNRGNGDVAAQL